MGTKQTENGTATAEGISIAITAALVPMDAEARNEQLSVTDQPV